MNIGLTVTVMIRWMLLFFQDVNWMVIFIIPTDTILMVFIVMSVNRRFSMWNYTYVVVFGFALSFLIDIISCFLSTATKINYEWEK